jgi:uncharacterized repeat protein (TIGR01451 family)
VVTLIADATKVIDRVEVTRNIFIPGSTGAASVSIGNVCWTSTEGVRVSGNVFQDSNGLTDSTVNGTGTNAGSADLTAYLIDSTTGFIAKKTSVSGSGTYTFATVIVGTYTVVLANTSSLAIGAAAPTPSLPATWTSTGENIGAGAGSDGTPDGKSAPIVIAAADVANVNFALMRAAGLSVTKTNQLSALTAGQTTSYTLTVANSGPADASGSLLRDDASTGLSSCTVTSCSSTGSVTAVCPATPSNVFTPGGAPIPTFPANSQLTLTVVCNVTATGL